MKPRIGITIGDPAGIGPEIVLKALANPKVPKICYPIVFGHTNHLKWLQRSLLRNHSSRRLQLNSFSPESLQHQLTKGEKIKGVSVIDMCVIPNKREVFGKPSALCGKVCGEFIEKAIKFANQGLVDGLVTAPINKISFRKGGWGKKFVGHTEMLVALTKTKKYIPMLVYEGFRCVQLTSHVPVRYVSQKIKKSVVEDGIWLALKGVKNLGVHKPKIGVAGVNPHAGDGGVLGKEEQREIVPAVGTCRKKGVDVQGPVPADVLWPQVLAGTYDVGVAMYHDQGQIPVKLLGTRFSKRHGQRSIGGVLVTVGLPFPRVSPFHGTGYDIAGKGVASEKSMIKAIETCVNLIEKKQQHIS